MKTPSPSVELVGWLITIFAALLTSALAQTHHPPPKPLVAPLIAERYPNDADSDRIDDSLAQNARQALAADRAALTPADKSQAQARLRELVDVELIFKEPVTQKQLDAFFALGGQITDIYKSVSYGWNGRLPLNKVSAVAAAMGATLVLVEPPRICQGTMDEATLAGRVRLVWSPGFAGSSTGLSGTTNITIAFADTGLDETHLDLAGRGVYWTNFTDEPSDTPTDLNGHGSLIAGVALGSGAAGGISGPVFFSQYGNNADLDTNDSSLWPMHPPTSSSTYTITARWLGGASTVLARVSRPNGDAVSLWTNGQATTGFSPLTMSQTASFTTGRAFSPALFSVGGPGVSNFVLTASVSNYPALDSFNRLRGVAPGCRWAAAKTRRADDFGFTTWLSAAIDDFVANRIEKNIKVLTIAGAVTGDPGTNLPLRQKVNSAVNSGIVVATAAGNDGKTGTSAQREIDDPGRAALALSVGAANDVNQLTDYTSHGFDPALDLEEDFKPDLTAPGGSSYYSFIMSVDSNNNDGPAWPDQRTNDYTSTKGTSLAAAFTAGCAALVIEAMERQGVQWDFTSSRHSGLVKMLLCATASEFNHAREVNSGFDPTLERDGPGPGGYPVGKDPYEGYGMINPDAAVEAVSLILTNGVANNVTFGSTPTNRRTWARTVNLTGGRLFTAGLGVPLSGDFDLYLYSSEPSSNGTPVLLASSAECCGGVSEALSYATPTNGPALLTIKRMSGSGTVNLLTGELPPPVITPGPPDPANFIFTFQSISGRMYPVQYKDFLDDPDWQVLQVVSGDGATKVVTDPLSLTQRFYRVAMQ